MKRILISAFVAVMLLSLAACGAKPSTKISTEPPRLTDPDGDSFVSAVGGVLSSFSTTDLNGNVVDQSVLANASLTMVNVWATYCKPCIREMPDLGMLAEEYKSKGVQIIGLVSDVLDSDGSMIESVVKTAQDVVQSTEANYLHLIPSQDLNGLISQITAVPTTFFVDEEGNQVGGVYIGSRSKTDWALILDEILAEVSQ